MTELKREYVVPLRRKTILAPKWRRSKKAMSVLTEFIQKHMKTDNVIVCPELNEKIWENGIKNPPGKVSVIALKTQINGVDKTLVNLAEIGIDNQMKLYATTKTSTEKTKEVKPEIKDAEVKETKPKVEKVADTETKEVKTVQNEEKKPVTKEEAKKDE